MADKLNWLRPTIHSADMARKNLVRRAVKYILPILALLLLLLSFYWAQEGQDIVAVNNIEQDLSEMRNTLETARFTSIDNKGRPFIVEADDVIQQDPNSMTAELNAPKGTLELNETDRLNVRANHGDYDHNAQTLDLSGDVVINQNDDVTFETSELDVDIKNNKASNNVPVHAVTKDGHTLDASAVDMTTDGGTIIFKGPAKLTVKSLTVPPKETEND